MEDNLKELLEREKEFRKNNNYYACYLTSLKILDEIQSKSETTKFDTISKLFLFPNQSNFVKLSLINKIIQNTSFINNKTTKKKYYHLLIESFSKGKDKEFKEEINKIKNLYEKSKLNDFTEMDEYIGNIVSEILYKSNIDTMNTNITGDSSLIHLSLKSPDLIDDSNENKANNSLEDVKSEDIKSEDISASQDISYINNNENKNNAEIKKLIRKYNANNKLPMIILSVSANLNSNQFLNLLNENFEKNNFYNICTIKNTDRDNFKIYEYHSKNCFKNIFSSICKNNNSKIQFQVMTILKRDENNFNMGINSFLNDSYERKITIKTIKGNQDNVIKSIIKILNSYCLYVEKIQIIKQSKCFLKYNLDQSLKKIVNNQKSKKYTKIYSSLSTNEDLDFNKNKKKSLDIILGKNTLVEKTNDNANKYYELYRIFSNKDYGLGKTISDFIENFKKEYNYSDKDNINVNEIDTKKAIMKIVIVCEESTNTLNSTFNYDDQSLNDKPIFFSNASEQFIINKIYPVLYNIYNIKYKTDNELYLQKKKEINEKLSIKEICDKIEIKHELRGNEKIPFKYVIDIINKISFEKSLKKKFEVITQASLEIRNCILDYTDCRRELDSMDDELPIVIYISTQLNVENLFAELYMIDDYVKLSLRDKLVQNKMVTNLLSSLFYISKMEI